MVATEAVIVPPKVDINVKTQGYTDVTVISICQPIWDIFNSCGRTTSLIGVTEEKKTELVIAMIHSQQ